MFSGGDFRKEPEKSNYQGNYSNKLIKYKEIRIN
jgi:hypothetical protein